jgi:acetate kinase
MRALPQASNVLCFDTAFHRRSPAIAHRLPLPNDLDPLLQRYGFHGLSYEYVASQLPANSGRTVIAHLGSGASLCAIRDGEPIDTTMGFTALGGLMMGTRPGDLDPGVMLRLLGNDRYDVEQLTDLLYHRSGLLGVSGSSADMRTLIEAANTNAAAREAVDLFVYQLIKQLGAMTAVLGGLDTLVFTGGIGEHAAPIRERVSAALAYLGDVATLVIPTDENLMIARHTLRVLRAG